MPGAHEYANKHSSNRILRRKQSNITSGVNEESDSQTALQDESQSNEGPKEPNGARTTVDISNGSVSSVGVLTPCTPTGSIPITPTTQSPHTESLPDCPSDAISTPSMSAPIATESGTAYGRNTPTQMHITLPPPPSSPSQIFSNPPALMRTPSGSGTASKHTSLSSSRPAPPSPSPIPSRRQSGVPSVRSRHRSGLSTASTSSSKFGTIKSPSQQPLKRKGEIKIRDFAFPTEDLRHTGRGPEAPKIIKKLLKHHGPLDVGSRRESGMSESSVDSEASSRRSSGFGNWGGALGAFRWASKLSGAWRFGGASGSRTSGGSGYTPSQQDFERNFDDTQDVDVVDSPADDDEYSSDYDDDADAEPEELLPGLYRALYDFDPEGTAEMGLKEGQIVKVVGRGGGVGWAIAVRTDAETEGGEANWALVPESYLKAVKLDELDTEEEGQLSPDDVDTEKE